MGTEEQPFSLISSSDEEDERPPLARELGLAASRPPTDADDGLVHTPPMVNRFAVTTSPAGEPEPPSVALQLTVPRFKRSRTTGSASTAADLESQLDECMLLRERDKRHYDLAVTQSEAMIAKLRRQVKFLNDEEEGARHRLVELERSSLEEKERLLAEVNRLQHAAAESASAQADLEAQLQTLTFQLSSTQHDLDMKSRQLGADTGTRDDVLSAMQADLAAARELAATVPVLQAEVESFKSAAAVKSAADATGKGLDVNALNTELVRLQEKVNVAQRRERMALAEMKREQSRRRNTELLDTQLASARAQVERLEAATARLATVEVQLQAAKDQRARWSEAFKAIMFTEKEWRQQRAAAGAPPSELSDPLTTITPDTVLSFVRELQQERLVLLSEKGTADGLATKAERATQFALKRVKDVEGELHAAEEARIVAEEKALRLERRCQLLNREKDSLKTVLESYKLEEEGLLGKAAAAGGAGGGAAATPSKAAQDHVKHLEASLTAAHDRLEKLDAEASQLMSPAVIAKSKSRTVAVEAELEATKKSMKRLEAQLSAVERENASLMSRVAKGEFNPAETKVVHFAMNPSKAALETAEEKKDKRLKALEAEVETLRQQAAAGTPAAAGMTPMAPPTDVEDATKRMQRLKEVFRERITTFREAVYLLTGYKVDMRNSGAGSSQTQLCLKSMYAEREEDIILLNLKDGKLELMETEYCRTIDKKIYAYLTTLHSIPAFLSSITLDLFEKQTFMPT